MDQIFFSQGVAVLRQMTTVFLHHLLSLPLQIDTSGVLLLYP